MEASSALSSLWAAGVVALWYLRPDQLDLYELQKRYRDPFLEAARRYGKTTTVLTDEIENMIKYSGWVTLWGEPWKNQAREIVQPEIEKILRTCPKRLLPKYQTVDSVYIWPNDSRLKLRGVNEDKGESSRGSYANSIVVDEYGSWKHAKYIINQVLRPQTLTTSGKVKFMSTPPEDLGHPYYADKAEAIREGRFIRRTIWDNKSLSREDIERIAKETGGTSSIAFRREYLCEEVSDPERLVVPEYLPDFHDVDNDYERPMFYTPYVGMDLGFNDKTFLTFSYFDFVKQELVIENELCVSGKNSKEIVDAAKVIERELWGDNKPRRFSDNDIQQLHDMSTLFGYLALATDKENRDGAINLLRLRFTNNKIKIKKRCINLRYQLKVGLWNESRKDFEKNKEVGHLDGIMSLVYLNRNINERLNPVPHMHGLDHRSMHINLDTAQSEERELANALVPFKGF